MTEGQFDHFSDLGHLLAATTDVIVSDTVKLFLVGTLDRFSLIKQHGVGRNNTELTRVYLNNLDSGARKWRDGVNGIRLLTDGTDPIRDFDDVVQAANN